MQNDGGFAIGDGKGAEHPLPDRPLNGVEFLSVRVILAEDENKLRDHATEGDAQKHEKLVEE